VDPLLKELRHNPILWLLALVPVALVAAKLAPTAHTLLFVLAVLAIVPLAALLSCATEAVAEKTGDTVGGLLNATLGNLTELVIAAAALRAGEYALVKGSIAGAIVTNTLFLLGASFLLGGLKHHIQEYNRATARLDAALLFLATIALMSPSAIAKGDLVPGAALTQKLSGALAVLLIGGYGLGLLFSLKTHREIFAAAEHAEEAEPAWPIGLALVTLAVVTVLVALVSEIFVESVQKAAETFGMSQAFVGFIVVALVGGAAEMAVAFSAARKDRLDLSVGIALVPDEIDIAVKGSFEVIQAMFSGEEPQVKGSQSSPQVKGFNNIVVAALGSDDVVSSVPQFLDGAIIGSVEHSLILCLCNVPARAVKPGISSAGLAAAHDISASCFTRASFE
jgi:Ca2+:H+ antiporter